MNLNDEQRVDAEAPNRLAPYYPKHPGDELRLRDVKERRLPTLPPGGAVPSA